MNRQFYLPKGSLTQYLHGLVLIQALHVPRGGRGLHGRIGGPADRAGMRRRHSHRGGRRGCGRGVPGRRSTGIVGGERDREVLIVESSSHGRRRDVMWFRRELLTVQLLLCGQLIIAAPHSRTTGWLEGVVRAVTGGRILPVGHPKWFSAGWSGTRKRNSPVTSALKTDGIVFPLVFPSHRDSSA